VESKILRTRVIRSPRRRKTVSARVENGLLTIYLPACISEADAQKWVDRMTRRMGAKLERDTLNLQQDLERRAERLNRKYFNGTLSYESIVYVTNQRAKYGSCSPGSRRIRISHRLAQMPSFVLDYVIFHELVHLVVPNHGRRFWKMVQRYPHTERAVGFLMGVGLVPAQELVVAEPSLWIPPEALPEEALELENVTGTGRG
jgi:predicted metal-dependent hydrolase